MSPERSNDQHEGMSHEKQTEYKKGLEMALDNFTPNGDVDAGSAAICLGSVGEYELATELFSLAIDLVMRDLDPFLKDFARTGDKTELSYIIGHEPYTQGVRPFLNSGLYEHATSSRIHEIGTCLVSLEAASRLYYGAYRRASERYTAIGLVEKADKLADHMKNSPNRESGMEGFAKRDQAQIEKDEKEFDQAINEWIEVTKDRSRVYDRQEVLEIREKIVSMLGAASS